MTVHRVHIRLLGGFDVTVDDRQVTAGNWRRRSAVSLVKLLALQPGRRMLREQVIDVLWPDVLVDEAAPRLHVAAHYARTATGARDAVVLAGGLVSLFSTADVTLDVDAFDRAADAARDAGGQENAAQAAALYSGGLLPEDLYEPWTEEPRERLRLRHLELLRAAGPLRGAAAAGALQRDTAGFIHHVLVREQLVRPRLEPEVFTAAIARGQELDVDVLLEKHGL